MSWFELVNFYYKNGLYKDSDVAEFVEGKSITPGEYQAITGKQYVPRTNTAK